MLLCPFRDDAVQHVQDVLLSLSVTCETRKSSIKLQGFIDPCVPEQPTVEALSGIGARYELGNTQHVPESVQGLKDEAVAAEALDEEAEHGGVRGARGVGSLQPAEDLEGVVGAAHVEVGREEEERDGGDVRVGLGGVEEVGEEGHGVSEVGVRGEGVDERGEVEGMERGVGEEGGGGEAQRCGELVRVAEAGDEVVDLR
ncbi:hypothetical protein SESBI_48201 [Sesbania bispinosa]|nr:hypothetical protein SESBI_48201 [Sesbania bispinosa]